MKETIRKINTQGGSEWVSNKDPMITHLYKEKLFLDEVEGKYISIIASEGTKQLVLQTLISTEGKVFTSFKVIGENIITDFETLSLLNALEVYNSI